MRQKELDEKELIEIWKSVKNAEHKAREMCQLITANTAKYQKWSETKQAERQKQVQ
ncbi:MAG: hypothetical protein MUE44_04905 [Oscillatoriaceae cyanobacterium Prado104]|jgi:hypothetical protein|nr:hypothetical protein [Oscillatoriaceae cyanobacterium Prado104]